MRALALTCEAIANLDSVEAKVQCAAAHLTLRSDADVATAARFLAGTPLPPGATSAHVGRAAIAAAVAERCCLPERALRRTEGDLGEAIAVALQAASPRGGPALPLAAASECIADLGCRSAAGREQRLRQLFRMAGPLEGKYLAKLMIGEMRIGMQAARIEDAIALAFDVSVDAVRRAHMLLGDIGEVARRARAGGLESVRLRCFRPVRYMLARSVRDVDEALAGAPPKLLVEHTDEGIRAQVHVRGGRHRVFSRNLEDVTHLFPEIGRVVDSVHGDWILDGEIVAFDGSALPLDKLMQRLGRRQVPLTLLLDVPVVFRAFDVLRAGGRDLIDEPLASRKEALAAIREAGTIAPLAYEITDGRGAAGLIEEAARRGGSVYLKDPGSRYTPGRRGGPWRRVAITQG